MKRFAIIALLILLIGAFILVPLLKNKGDDDDFSSGFPASFALDGDIGAKYGEAIPIAFTVKDADIKQVQLIYNDSVFKTWDAPKPGKQVFRLDASFYGLGTRYIVLRSIRNDGTQEEDSRMLRVVSDISPKYLKATAVATFPHDASSYTQGLEFNNGQLYEGTGDPGQKGASIIAKVDLKTGKIGQKNGLDATHFGEGITIMGDELFQLTWQTGKCFVYDKNNLMMKLKEFTYTGEGWGLCNDGKYLIMSDGSEHIYFRDPKTFAIVRIIDVYDDVKEYSALNELEYVDGKIYANVYTTNTILAIEPETGRVLEVIDASPLVPVGKLGGEVLNGIAYNPATKKLYMTGKYWGKVMEVRITE